MTVTEWGDFQCPSCGLFERNVASELKADYVAPGLARFEYRDYAFMGQSRSARRRLPPAPTTRAPSGRTTTRSFSISTARTRTPSATTGCRRSRRRSASTTAAFNYLLRRRDASRGGRAVDRGRERARRQQHAFALRQRHEDSLGGLGQAEAGDRRRAGESVDDESVAGHNAHQAGGDRRDGGSGPRRVSHLDALRRRRARLHPGRLPHRPGERVRHRGTVSGRAARTDHVRDRPRLQSDGAGAA